MHTPKKSFPPSPHVPTTFSVVGSVFHCENEIVTDSIESQSPVTMSAGPDGEVTIPLYVRSSGRSRVCGVMTPEKSGSRENCTARVSIAMATTLPYNSEAAT